MGKCNCKEKSPQPTDKEIAKEKQRIQEEKQRKQDEKNNN